MDYGKLEGALRARDYGDETDVCIPSIYRTLREEGRVALLWGSTVLTSSCFMASQIVHPTVEGSLSAQSQVYRRRAELASVSSSCVSNWNLSGALNT